MWWRPIRSITWRISQYGISPYERVATLQGLFPRETLGSPRMIRYPLDIKMIVQRNVREKLAIVRWGPGKSFSYDNPKEYQVSLTFKGKVIGISIIVPRTHPTTGRYSLRPLAYDSSPWASLIAINKFRSISRFHDKICVRYTIEELYKLR